MGRQHKIRSMSEKMKEANKHLVVLTPEKEELFYKTLEENGASIMKACETVGISHGTYKNHYLRKPAFGVKCNKIIARVKLLKVKKKPQKVVVLKEKKKNGRPTLFTEELLKKIEDAFSQGLSVSDVCILADVSLTSFYNYCEKVEGFLEKCKKLQQKPAIKSIININKSLNSGDISTSKWYLEKKRPEFSNKPENQQSFTNNIINISQDDYKNILKEIDEAPENLIESIIYEDQIKDKQE